MPISKHIIKIIKKNDPAVQDIDLSNQGLFDEDIKELVQLLLKNPYITSVNLSYNNIRSEGAKALVALTSLKKLDVSENSLGDLGVKYLLRITSIESLNLTDNAITNKGAKLLLKNVVRYTSLEIEDNYQIDSSIKQKINEALQSKKAEFLLKTSHSPSFFESENKEPTKIDIEKPGLSSVDFNKSLTSVNASAVLDKFKI